MPTKNQFPLLHSEAQKFLFGGSNGDFPKAESQSEPVEGFKPKTKAESVFRRGGMAEINAQLRHEKPELPRRKRRKLAKKMLKQRQKSA